MPGPNNSPFVPVATLREGSLVATITRAERRSGFIEFSFIIMKEFERGPGAPVEHTAYLSDRHLGAVRRLLDAIETELKLLREGVHAQRRAAPATV